MRGKDFVKEFDRNLELLLQQKGVDKIRGIVFGRFQKKFNNASQAQVLFEVAGGVEFLEFDIV